MPFIELEDVNLSVGGKSLLEDAYLKINPGDRIGIVGRNGSGKSQLMQLLAGNTAPDGGKLTLAKGATVVLVRQELPVDDRTPIEYLRDNDPDILALEAIMEGDSSGKAVDAAKFTEACDRLSELDDERYEKLAPMVLRGLGLTEAQLTEPMKNLSGGMRMRIGFAMALVRTPDVLLLDEPTNYLDLEASRWLTKYLSTYPPRCAVVMVTHDVALLMEACTSTVHLRGGKLTAFDGDYALYLEELETRARKDAEKSAVLVKIADKKEEQYYKQRGIPSRGAHAVQQLKMAEALREKIVVPIVEEPVVELSFGEPAPLHDPVIKLTNVAVGYGAKTVLSKVNVSIQSGVKVGLLGRNGEGKTTLLRLLADDSGTFVPKSGDVVRSGRLKIGYFSQELSDQLDVRLTVYEQFQASTGIKADGVTRDSLGRYGFSDDKVDTPVAALSGGEKSRLLFALICARAPNLIILDEPTNHLDVETREALVKAITNFPGSILLVSHDFDLQAKTMQQFWLVKDGTVQVYDKGFKHYQRQLELFIERNLPGAGAKGASSVVAKAAAHGGAGGKSASPGASVPHAAAGAGGGKSDRFFKPGSGDDTKAAGATKPAVAASRR